MSTIDDKLNYLVTNSKSLLIQDVRMYSQTGAEIKSFDVEIGRKYLIMSQGAYNRYITIYSGAIIEQEVMINSDYNTTNHLKAFLVEATETTIETKSFGEDYNTGITIIIGLV